MRLFRIEAIVSLDIGPEDECNVCALDWFDDVSGADIKILDWHETPMYLTDIDFSVPLDEQTQESIGYFGKEEE